MNEMIFLARREKNYTIKPKEAGGSIASLTMTILRSPSSSIIISESSIATDMLEQGNGWFPIPPVTQPIPKKIGAGSSGRIPKAFSAVSNNLPGVAWHAANDGRTEPYPDGQNYKEILLDLTVRTMQIQYDFGITGEVNTRILYIPSIRHLRPAPSTA